MGQFIESTEGGHQHVGDGDCDLEGEVLEMEKKMGTEGSEYQTLIFWT